MRLFLAVAVFVLLLIKAIHTRNTSETYRNAIFCMVIKISVSHVTDLLRFRVARMLCSEKCTITKNTLIIRKMHLYYGIL